MLSKKKMLQLFQEPLIEEKSYRNQLIEENLELVYYIVRKYQYCKVDLLELFDVGIIGLIKAIDTFNIDKNIKLATYAGKCIENEILLFLKRNKKWNYYVQFSTPVCYDEHGKECLLEDVLACNSDDLFIRFELACTCEEIRYVLNKLSKRDRQIILLYFGFIHDYCYTQEEISKIMGISQSFVSRVIRISLKKLKQELFLLEKGQHSKLSLKKK